MPTRRATLRTGISRRAVTIRCAAFAVLWAVVAANAQSGGAYVIRKSTVDSGGRKVTGGAYALTGTVGQPDAGDPAGGAYNLTGGFWSAASTATSVNPPLPEPGLGRAKNRYVSFAPNNGPTAVKFKVTRTYPLPVADIGWVDDPDGAGLAKVRPIGDAPASRVWNEAVVHAGDCEIFPVPNSAASPLACSIGGAACATLCGAGACPPGQGECIPPPTTYELRATDDGLTFSAPLAVNTVPRPCPKGWGDTVGVFDNGTNQWTPPNGTANVNDFLAALQKFQSLATAPHVTVVDVVGAGIPGQEACLNRSGNISDVFNLIKAFQGAVYPFTTDPGSCPACP